MVLLAAPRHDGIPTGGFRYNRLIAAALPEDRLRLCSVAETAELAGLPAREELAAEDVLLADSLFFSAPEAVEELRAAFSGALWMLVHYLPSLDPTLGPAEREERRRAEDRCLRCCDGAAATGPFTVRQLRRREACPPRVVTAEPGVERRFFAAAAEDGPPGSTAASSCGPAEDGPVMVTAANWSPLKNHRLLLPVLEELSGLPWRWRILGDCGRDGELCRRFSAEAERRGVAGRIALCGAKSPAETAEEMAAADIYLSPSLLESYGMSVAEAMAAGCAVAAADRGGTAELIRHGEDGLLCDPERPEQWRQALQRLLSRPAERRRLAAAARRRAEEFPSWEESAGRLLRGIGEGAE
jgi:glycosyltransferase involved in cell wall biosynthesis